MLCVGGVCRLVRADREERHIPSRLLKKALAADRRP